ncbi:GPW/gp25 family protein [Pararhodobacter zhoushanensis]|uniref:GPW/gp25 family protein n=1 Tax=Pararhodobacter zhoushanensis TaxID=2479545 RepID=UPI000F8CCDFC|nr:GPW/gp25 family protein [Pararhodobacter zhoushanensis]
MIGTDATTGKHIEGLAHLRQSIRDILTTRKGTRVMRRAYGSDLPSLIDAPVNDDTILDIIASTAEALAIWEPRIDVQLVSVNSLEPGRIVLTVEGIYTPTGDPIAVDGIEV